MAFYRPRPGQKRVLRMRKSLQAPPPASASRRGYTPSNRYYLGFSEAVHPGATDARFAHSLGVFHVARQLMRIIEAHRGRDRFRTR